MASSLSLFCQTFFWFLILSDSYVGIMSLEVGINYGQIANNLPSPSRVSALLKSLNISRVKLYNADLNVLQAFSNTNIDFIIGIGNEDLSNMTDSSKAQDWVQQYVLSHLPQTKITCILVGNEVLGGNYTDQLMSYLLPAMQSVHESLVNLGLQNRVTVTTAHSLNILANSYPPSSGTFREDLVQYLQPLLDFHAQIGSPFLINAYPYFAYKGSPDQVSLDYILFKPNDGQIDPNTNLKYDNMLYAQVDAVYSAIKLMGHTDIEVRVSETGWPSKGGSDEAGATPENAGVYNGNLLKRIEEKQGTPGKPLTPIGIYVFALFNEDLKPGPVSERNYGLFYPNGTPVYDIGLQSNFTIMDSASASDRNVFCTYKLLVFLVTWFLFV